MGVYSRIGISPILRREKPDDRPVDSVGHGENLIPLEGGEVCGRYRVTDLGAFGSYNWFTLPGGHDEPLSMRIVREEKSWALTFIFHYAGASDMALPGESPKGYLGSPGAQALFYSAGEARVRMRAPHGFRSLSLVISLDWIAEHLGVDAAPPSLREGIERRAFSRMMRHDLALSPALARIQREAERHPYRDGMERLFMQARTLDTLNEVFLQLDDRKPSAGRSLARGERERIMEAREILFSDPVNPPTLSELARRVGLSYKRLNAGFRTLYGKTCFVLLQEHRLEMARNAMKGENASLEEAATRAGYGHVSNFITAYRNLFGVTPGRDR